MTVFVVAGSGEKLSGRDTCGINGGMIGSNNKYPRGSALRNSERHGACIGSRVIRYCIYCDTDRGSHP